MAKPGWDEIDPDDLVRLRNKRLRRQIRFQLYAFSPYYRRVMDDLGVEAEGFDGIADLPKLPAVDRPTFARHSSEFLLQPSRPLLQRWASSSQVTEILMNKLLRGIDEADRLLSHDYEPVHTMMTAGMSGQPLSIKLARRDIAVISSAAARTLEIAGVKTGEPLLNLLSQAQTYAFWTLWLGGVALGARQVAPGFVEPQEAVSIARDSRATTVIAFAEDALALAEAAGEAGLPDLQTLILAPEAIPVLLETRLRDAFSSRVRIIRTYGFAESRSVWAECHQSAGQSDAGFHLMPDLDAVEVISGTTGTAARTGQPGEVYYTGLDQRGSAVARYRPGDVAMSGLATGRCPHCGRNIERVMGPVRRTENLLEVQFPGSDLLAVDVEVLSAALTHPGVRAWHAEVSKVDGDPRGADQMFVFFQPDRGVDAARIAIELDQMMRAEVGFSPTQFVLGPSSEAGVVDLRQGLRLSEARNSVANRAVEVEANGDRTRN